MGEARASGIASYLQPAAVIADARPFVGKFKFGFWSNATHS